MDWQALLIAGVGALGGGGIAGVAVALIRRPVDSVGAATAFQQALNSQAQAFIATLAQINDGLEKQVGQLEGRVRELEEENLQCRGENRDLRQRLDSLERGLKRRAPKEQAGGPPPPPSKGLTS
jgi:TolA-binding protein